MRENLKHTLKGSQDIGLEIRPGFETTIWLPNPLILRMREDHEEEEMLHVYRRSKNDN